MKIVIINGSYRKNGATALISNRGHFVMEQLLYGKYAISVTTYKNYDGEDSAKILNRILSYSVQKK